MVLFCFKWNGKLSLAIKVFQRKPVEGHQMGQFDMISHNKVDPFLTTIQISLVARYWTESTRT